MIWNEGFNLEEALKKAQLSDKNYATLIQCVYTQFSNKKSAKPLFIQYDGTEENMMNILFCIYSAIPLSMRRKLSVASVVTSNTVDKNIIFSINAKEKEQYIVPNTGENNILTNRMERKISSIRHSNGVKKFLIADGNHALSRRSRMLHNQAEKIMGITDDE